MFSSILGGSVTAGVSSVLGASVASAGAVVSVAGAAATVSSFFLGEVFTFFSLLPLGVKGASNLWRRLGLFLPDSVVSGFVSVAVVVSSFVASVGA